MKPTAAQVLFPIPAFSAALQRGSLSAAIYHPKPNVPAFLPSHRSGGQPPLSEQTANAQKDHMESLHDSRTAHPGFEPGRAALPRRRAERQVSPAGFMDRDKVGGDGGTGIGGVSAGSRTIGRPVAGRSCHGPGRAALLRRPADRQVSPTGVMVATRDFEIRAAHPEPDLTPEKNQPANKTIKAKNQIVKRKRLILILAALLRVIFTAQTPPRLRSRSLAAEPSSQPPNHS